MKIENIKISELKPYEKNPRNNEKAIDKVTASISEFGFRVPIVIDKNKVIVCGHTRFLAARKLKIKEVPCVIADDLSDEQISAFRLVDNKTQELSTWDFTKLIKELEEIIDVNMEIFGFDSGNKKTEKKEQNLNSVGEIDLDNFDDDSFDSVCPACGFRFNEEECDNE